MQIKGQMDKFRIMMWKSNRGWKRWHYDVEIKSADG